MRTNKLLVFYLLRRLRIQPFPRYVSTAKLSVASTSQITLPKNETPFSKKYYNYNKENVTDDDRLALIGDFIGVQPSPLTLSNRKEKSPFTVIAMLQDEILMNRRLRAHLFINSVLHPLEEKSEPFCSTLKKSTHVYVPALINMCGNVMSDVPVENRMIILNRLIKAIKQCGIEFCMEDINAMVDVWNENYHVYDVWQLLNFVEKKLELQPDAQFFSSCAWRLAQQGDMDKLSDWKKLAQERGIQPTEAMALAEIFCAENRKDVALSESLIEEFTKNHVSSSNDVAYTVALQGAAWSYNMQRMNEIVNKFTVENEKMYSSPMIGLPQATVQVLHLVPEMTFEAIWILTMRHSKDNGNEFADFTTMILNRLKRETGYFKLMVSHIERHIVHRFYYTAVAIIADTNRIRNYLSQQSRDSYIRQMLGKISNQMIRNDFSISKIKGISDKIVAVFGKWTQFYDSLMYSVLTHRLSTHEQCLDRFMAFVDLQDPQRERVHLILPLMVRAPTLESRCKLLYICSSLGYKDFSNLDAHVLYKILYQPMLARDLERFRRKSGSGSIWSYTGEMANRLTTFGISRPEVWRMCYILLKDLSNDRFFNHRDFSELEAWLRGNVDFLKEEKANVATPLKQNVTVVDILNALRNEFKKNPDILSLTNIVYDLKRRYPDASASPSFQFDTFRETTNLFAAILENEVLTQQRVDEIIEFYTTLVKLGFLRLHTMEILTADIVYKTLIDIGWDASVETWLKFQSSFHCSNAIVELLNFVISRRIDEEVRKARLNFIMHKAYNFMQPQRVKALYACTLLRLGKMDEAVEYLKSCDPMLSFEDYKFGFHILIARASKIGVVKDLVEFPLNLCRTVLQFGKEVGMREKVEFAQPLIYYCNKNTLPLLLLDLCNELNEARVPIKAPHAYESKRTVNALKDFSRQWISSKTTGLLNNDLAYPILSSHLSEINVRLASINRNFKR